jgi:carbon storage regulator
MLVLTRRIDERIIIGESIVLTVIGLSADRVRIGIEAPAGVEIDREEVRKAKERERRARV